MDDYNFNIVEWVGEVDPKGYDPRVLQEAVRGLLFDRDGWKADANAFDTQAQKYYGELRIAQALHRVAVTERDYERTLALSAEKERDRARTQENLLRAGLSRANQVITHCEQSLCDLANGSWMECVDSFIEEGERKPATIIDKALMHICNAKGITRATHKETESSNAPIQAEG